MVTGRLDFQLRVPWRAASPPLFLWTTKPLVKTRSVVSSAFSRDLGHGGAFTNGDALGGVHLADDLAWM